MLAKYPFNPNATAQATLADVNALFKPKKARCGSSTMQNLQKVLHEQGSQYVAGSAAAITITPAFLAFLNRAAAFSDAVYAGGSADPHFNYTVKPLPTAGYREPVTLSIDGQTLTSRCALRWPRQFALAGCRARACN